MNTKDKTAAKNALPVLQTPTLGEHLTATEPPPELARFALTELLCELARRKALRCVRAVSDVDRVKAALDPSEGGPVKVAEVEVRVTIGGVIAERGVTLYNAPSVDFSHRVLVGEALVIGIGPDTLKDPQPEEPSTERVH